jgi:hypothetical protein
MIFAGLIRSILGRGISLALRFTLRRMRRCSNVGCPRWSPVAKDHCQDFTSWKMATCHYYKRWPD